MTDTQFEALAAAVEGDFSNLEALAVLADYMIEWVDVYGKAGEALAYHIDLERGNLDKDKIEEIISFLIKARKEIVEKYGLAEQEIHWFGAFPSHANLNRGQEGYNKESIDQLLQSPDGQFTKLSATLVCGDYLEDLFADYDNRFHNLCLKYPYNRDVHPLVKSNIKILNGLELISGNIRTSTYHDLFNSDVVKKLNLLGLDDMDLTDADVVNIAQSPNLQNLKYLFLTNTDYNLRNDSLAALVRSPYLRNLEILKLTDTRINNRGAELLLQDDTFPCLQELVLTNIPNLTASARDSLREWADERGINLRL